MKIPVLMTSIILLQVAILQVAPAQEGAFGSRDKFVSDASFVVGTYQPKKSGHSPEAIAKAGEAFLSLLDADQRKKTLHAIDSPERRRWTNLPARPNAGGIRLGELNESQLKAACDLMRALFSQQGYDKLCHIMLADDQLLRNGRPNPGFGTETFSVVVFSTPSPAEPWAFQIDGHHVGVNVSLNGKAMTMSPSFIGTQPEAFNIGDREFRPFAGEVDEAYKLIGSLTDEQRKAAIIRPRRGFIRTGPGKDGHVPAAQGVSCSTFSEDQKKNLLKLISQWVNNLPEKQAAQRMKQLENEIDKMKFAWNGPTAPRSDVSYSIQGPSLIIEYACQDLGGNPLDHLHSNYRDPTNEYGNQLERGDSK